MARVRACVVPLLLLGAVGASAAERSPQSESVLAPLAEKSLILDLARAGTRLVAVGERGHVLLSDDDGVQWRQVTAPTRSTLTAVHFADPRTAFAVGHDAVILRSLDAGETWQLVHADPEEEAPLLDVYFFDAQRGIAVGAYAYYLETVDGGETWDTLQLNEEDDFHLNKIAAAPNGDLFVAAEAGFIYRSRDDGGSWDSLDSPYEGSFFGVLSDPADELLVFGLRGHLFSSDDGGEQWRAIELATGAMLTDAARLTDGRAVIVGLQGTVLVQRDDGFDEYELPSRAGLTAVVAVGDALVLAGDAGVSRVRLEELPVRDAAR